MVHGTRCTIDPVQHGDDVIDAQDHQDDRRDAMDHADRFDAAEQIDDELAQRRRRKFLRQAREDQHREGEQQDDVLDALQDAQSVSRSAREPAAAAQIPAPVPALVRILGLFGQSRATHGSTPFRPGRCPPVFRRAAWG